MAFFNGKSGADAIFKALHKICQVLGKYQAKLLLAIAAALASGLITSDEATAANTFVTGATALCNIFERIASNSGFSPD